MKPRPPILPCILLMGIAPLAAGGSFGEAPGDARESLIRQILDMNPVEPNARRTDVPDGLNALVIAMLNKEANRRPDGQELMHRLTRLMTAAA